MLLYICTCLMFLSVVKFPQVKTLKPSIVKPVNDGTKIGDAIFSDVIKNISRVNHVLQELINNYEQLQKIYKSQENVDSVDSDSEIDEVFKSKNGKEHAKRTRGKLTTKKTISEKFAATQMFWSDHEEDNENSNDVTDDEEETVKETVKADNTLEPKVKGTPSNHTTTLRPVSSEESSDESSDTSDVSQAKMKIKKEVVEKTPNKLKPQSEVIFIDTHKKTKEVTTPAKPRDNLKNKFDSVVQFAGVPTKKKTRYSKVSHSQGTNSEIQTQNVASNAGSNDNREVKKIMYAESFSPKKIWNDILNNKPIQLEAHNEITLRRVESLKKNNTATNKRSKGVGKSAVVVDTKSKKQGKATLSSEEDDSALKEQFKTNVLRQAYGDACLKLVLRKCHKACKKVSKTACNRVKCKRNAKSAFLTAAKAGCIKEFNGDTAVTTEVPKDNTRTNFRGQSNQFVDMTRTGFLSAACLPHAQTVKATLRNASQSQTNPEQNFNILRDRYERACKRISSDKCRTACNYATTQMCETNTCSKRMKKMFKKVCKEQCQAAYGLNKADSGSESESESGSESESDSETD